MADAQSRRLSGYSRGMRQRVRLAAALVHEPQVLILDEPLSGTDPRQRLQFHEAMSRFAGEGRTLLVSSHILEEVELLADSIVLMVSGRLAGNPEATLRNPDRTKPLASEGATLADCLTQFGTLC